MDYSNQSNQDFNQPQQSSFEEIPPRPQNNLVLAIIATALGVCSPCCISMFLGIVAIVFSTQANSKFDTGNYQAAEQAAKNAKILSYVAFGITALYLVYVIFVFITQGGDAILDQYQGVLDNAGGGN